MNSYDLFVQRKFKEVAKFIPKNSKILDLGCHDAKIINFLENPNYFGIDGDSKIVKELISKKINVRLIDLNKDTIPFKEEKFDYILLLDILEHVVNPSKLLEDTKKRLNLGGKLIVTLPNDYHLLNKLRFVFNKHLTEDPFAPYGHLHYFPIRSGKKFLIENNLKVIKKINLPPIKPKFIPQWIKNTLSKLFSQAFTRDVLYVLTPNN